MPSSDATRRAVGIAAAAAVVGLIAAILTHGWARWLSTALVLTAGPLPLRALGQTSLWQRRRSRLPFAVLLALFLVLLAPLLHGEPPASRDHAIHYFQMHLLVDEMLPSGRLWGWSPTLNHGYPFGESYPVLGYLWMSAAHLLSFGAISLRTSYAWGLIALWMISAAVAWWLAALMTRELASAWPSRAQSGDDGEDEAASEGDSAAPEDEDASAPQETSTGTRDETSARVSSAVGPGEVARWAGLVAAVLWLLDSGESRQGGWIYLMYHGVWPQLMAATFWAGSLGLTLQALGDPRPRRLALAVLALGAALWSHPFGLLTVTASMAIWAVMVLLSRDRWPGPWRTWAIIHVAGIMLGGGWLATFFGSSEAMARSPVLWTSLGEMGARLLQGQLLPNIFVWAAPLGLLGAVLVLRRGGSLGWAVLGLAVGQLVLASEEAITVLRLDLVLSGFKNLQFPRYTISFKPLWFALGGVAAGQVLVWSRSRRPAVVRPFDSTPMGWVRRAAIGLLVAPLLSSVVPQSGRVLKRPLGAIDTIVDEDAEHEAALRAALEAEAAALPEGQPLVVAVMRAGMGGGTYPMMTVADLGGRLVLDEHIPTVNFKHQVRRRPAGYEALGVTHVIHDRPVPETERSLASSLEEIGTFGVFTLERFLPPHGLSRRIAELEGFGSIEVEVDEPEHLVLEVRDVPPGTPLLIGRAPHVRWEVTYDGALLDFEERRVDGTAAIEVAMPGSGRIELRYTSSALERRALLLSAVIVLLCGVGLFIGGPPLATAPLSLRGRVISAGLVAVLVVVATVVIVTRQSDKLQQTWKEYADDRLDRRPDDDLVPVVLRDLVQSDEIDLEQTPARVCNGLVAKHGELGCSEDAHRPNVSFLYREPYLYRCLRFSVPANGGTVTLRFPPLPSEHHVILGSLRRHKKKGSGRLLFWGSQWINKPVKNRLHDFVLDQRHVEEGVPTLILRNDNLALDQVCISAALVERPPLR